MEEPRHNPDPLMGMSAAQRRLLEFRLKKRKLTPATPDRIPRRPPDSPIELSLIQERLWFLEQLNEGQAVYNRAQAFRLTGRVEVRALQQSLNAILARHEILRMTIPSSDGRPAPYIEPSLDTELVLADLTSLPSSSQEAEAKRIACEEAERPFDITRAPFLRAKLIRLSMEEHVFVLVVHHLVSDAWSDSIFWKEFEELYNSFVSKSPCHLPELPLQYVDFAIWQRQWLQGKVLETQLSYWTKQLQDVAVLQLPTDRPRPAVQSYRGARQSSVFSKALSDQLQALSRKQGVTLFMTLLAAFQTLLHRYSGQEDIVVGTPIAGRTRSETEGLIGFFVNTLVLRSDLSANPTFRELLGRVRKVALEAYEHQDLPFEKLVEELHPERDLSRSPLFQVMFTHQNVPRQSFELPGLTVRPVEIHNDTAKFDLSLFTRDETGGLKTTLEYNTDLYDAATIKRLLGHFEVLLEGIVANPDQRLSELPILTEAERHQLLVEWNDTKRDYPSDKCIHELFEAQVERTPDAIALVFEDKQLSYRELNTKANQLGHYLRKLGVGPEVLVGICMERSLEMVIGLLGILKAGGAYVPLDSAYPKERLSFMVRDATVEVLLTDNKHRNLFPFANDQAICLDSDWPVIAQESTSNLNSAAIPSNLAYVMYTSGSTGEPKGVMVLHSGLVNYLSWAVKTYSVEAGKSVPVHTSISFDLTVTALYAPLLAGGRIEILPEDVGGQSLVTALRKGKDKSLVKITPAHLELLSQQINPEEAAGRTKIFVIGGENLLAESLRLWRKFAPATRLINEYGPTETVVGCCVYEVGVDDPGSGAVPIGRPIANTQLYVLDRYMNPVPIGVMGELFIGGAGLARGYLNRPELTTEKFIPNPFSDEPGARLYKTGDLARYLPDGNTEFLGRVDHQVKIRGFRIELGEIESVLSQHPTVREVVVVAREDGPGKKRLVGYVVPSQERAPTIGELRSFLQAKLPDYMVPSIFVMLEALPLTPNGKIDRRALPLPDQRYPDLERNFVAPGTPVEEELAQIWSKVLSVGQVGIHDNFFDLGGHSLLATQVISLVRQVFHLDLPLRTLFEAPTVAGLAESIETALRSRQGLEIPPIVPVSRDGDLSLSFAQQRLWFLDQLEPESSFYNISQSHRLEGVLNVEALRKSLSRILERHEALRTTLTLRDGNPTQVVGESQPCPLTVVNLGEGPDSQRQEAMGRILDSETKRPFDLSRDLMVRATLLRLGPSEHVLLLVTHHIASDGWSSGILWQELATLYAAFSRGEPDPLPELPIQYADYAVWQRQWLQGKVLETPLSYWKQQLHDVTVLQLPTDRPRPAMQSYRGARQSSVFSKALSDQLQALGRKQGTTLFMTLLAAFQILLHRYSGQEDIVVGTPIAGRTRSETEGLIGFFVNTLVLRNDLSANPTFRELLGRVRKVALEAYEHQDLPFEKLVEELHPDRDLSRSPLFQVTFAHQNVPRQSFELPGLTVSPVETINDTAKFDLSLYTRDETGGLKSTLEYNTDLFDAATIKRLLGHFEVLLEGIVANPDQRLSELPILTEAERHQLLVEWNDTKTDYPNDKCIHELFEAQVERTPDAIALVFEDKQLSYRELNTRANQLGHYLRKLGVGPEVLVGLCVERSLEMVIGLLGILKAGGAYVPLEPSYPKERLAFMIEDSQVFVLLTQESLLSRLSSERPQVVCLDTNWDAIAQGSVGNPLNRTSTENLAYLIYTSGSTGRPKGVAVEHRQLLNYLVGILDRLNLPAHSSFATVSTIAADLGNTVIFPSLCAGGSLHVISQERVSDSDAMADYFGRHSIDCLKIVPSHLAALLQTSAQPERMLPHKLLILGGEAASLDWVKSLRRLVPGCAILNHYGPTEATIGVLTYRVEQDQLPSDLTTLPLGRPIANTLIYLLDQHLNPVPVGMPGEVHIAGAGLTRGYLNRAELTAEKFIPNPFSDEPGARLYKTGDLAQYLPDGNIKFLGRTDLQIKIRGYRVEPGEIEAVLRQHSSVQGAAVLARESILGEKRLVAYVVTNQDHAATVAGKRRYQLLNRAAVAQLNKYETDYMYQEIFERQAYLRHGITFQDGDCIFDIGANIGLFMLFAHQVCKRPKVYSFEPNPAVFELLSANASLYGLDVKLFNFGLSNEAKTSTFTFFPGYSLLSGFYADPTVEKQVVKAFMMNQQKAGVSDMAELIEQADGILDERFSSQTFTAQLRTLSSIIEQEEIESIDLLKINVEKSELDVLSGIKEHDWKKIKQIILEVDVRENLSTITSLLEKHGFEFIVKQDVLLETTELCYVYAIRPYKGRKLDIDQREGTHIRPLPAFKDHFLSVSELRSFLETKLPDYMVPSIFVMLDALPLTPNGKVDRNALPVPDQSRPNVESSFVAPRTQVEALVAAIWAQVLKLERVGIEDNFFELGGHSLLAMQVVSRIRIAFELELPLRDLFEKPTVAGLAERLETIRWATRGVSPVGPQSDRAEIKL